MTKEGGYMGRYGELREITSHLRLEVVLGKALLRPTRVETCKRGGRLGGERGGVQPERAPIFYLGMIWGDMGRYGDDSRKMCTRAL